MKCPKCNKTISKTSTKCRYCSSLLVKEEIEILEVLPNNKENRVKKEIPLMVKKVTKPKKEINKNHLKELLNKKVKEIKHLTKKSLPTKKEWATRVEEFKFSLKIIIVIMLFVISVVLVKNIRGELQKREPEKIQIKEKGASTLLENSWSAKEGDRFIFNDDLTFKWSRTKNTELNNYYEGTYTYKQGTQALDDMGLTLQELELELNKKIDLDNIYSMVLLPNKEVINNQIKSLVKEEEKWWYILIKEDEENAIALNKTLDKRYTLFRK